MAPISNVSRIVPAFLGLALSLSFASCAGDAGQLTDLQDKLTEQKTALSDTITYYSGELENLRFMVDSLQAELSKFSGAVSGGGTAPSTSKSSSSGSSNGGGTVDVGTKGKTGDAPSVDVSTKGSVEATDKQPKVTVSKKGKGGGR